MNGYERTTAFVNNQKTDRPPFMPLVIDWAVEQLGVDYTAFGYSPKTRAEVYLETTRRFGIDCVLPDADFHEQLADFGMELALVDGRYSGAPFITELEKTAETLTIPTIAPNTRMGNRVETLRLIAEQVKGKQYIFGICVGPFTEFCNARGTQNAMFDLIDNEAATAACIQIFYQNCLQFIDAQLAAGADGIQIVEPACSIIGPALYEKLVLPLHAALVARVQQNGGFARLHICGDTNAYLPMTLGTGARILDVDYPVRLDQAAEQLAPNQVLCGNLNPAEVLLAGTPAQIAENVRAIHSLSGGRCIISAGCDVPQDTPLENMLAFRDACFALGE